MRTRILAHLSDLHLGLSPAVERGAARLVDELCASAVDHVVVTGDITHGGRVSELERFRRLFAPLEAEGRLTVVPGNHDRLGDDVGGALMPEGVRVAVEAPPGLYMVRVDSTGPHNRSLLAAHGDVCAEVLDRIDVALEAAPTDRLVVLLLHHHPLPLPEESFVERFSNLVGWPYTLELTRGRELIERVRGRCDLILHGHRHVPREITVPDSQRPLRLFNAGCSSALGRARLFSHHEGVLLGAPFWMPAGGARPELAGAAEASP